MIRFALAFLLLAAPAGAETLRIGTEAHYPPYMTYGPDGQLRGFDKDLGDAICAMLAAECLWTDAAFDSLLPDLSAGHYDMVIAALSASPGRQGSVAFSAPYLVGGTNISVFAGLNPGQPVETARIGVQAGTIQADHLRATGRDVVLFPSAEAALAALMRREIDLVFTSDLVLRDAVEGRYPGLRRVAGEEVESWDTAIALARGRDDLRARIDAAIERLRADGTIAALEARWFVDGTSI